MGTVIEDAKSEGYRKGYAAGRKGCDQLKRKVSELRTRNSELKEKLENLGLTSDFEARVRWLLESAETLTKAAETLIEIRPAPEEQ